MDEDILEGDIVGEGEAANLFPDVETMALDDVVWKIG